MQKILFLFVLVIHVKIVFAQNVGVGTNTPQQKLHVAGTMRVNDDFTSYQSGVIKDSMVIGTPAGSANAKLRVAGGLTRTDDLTVGGQGFPNKMLSVYGDAEIMNNTLIGSLNVTGDGFVGGLQRINGRIGINGATNPAYGLIVNNADSYLNGDLLIAGNKRINGRIGINGATNSSYGLIVNNANSYLQGSARVQTDALVNGNSRINGRFGINGSTHLNYGLIVNNAHSYFQGNVTISGDLNVLGNSDFTGTGTVSSNGSSSIRIGYIKYHINNVYFGNEDSYNTFDIPEFGPNVDDIRVSVFQYVDGYNDPVISNPNDIRWWISDVDPVNNTARIRSRNLSVGSRALRGDFYILIMVRE